VYGFQHAPKTIGKEASYRRLTTRGIYCWSNDTFLVRGVTPQAFKHGLDSCLGSDVPFPLHFALSTDVGLLQPWEYTTPLTGIITFPPYGQPSLSDLCQRTGIVAIVTQCGAIWDQPTPYLLPDQRVHLHNSA